MIKTNTKNTAGSIVKKSNKKMVEIVKSKYDNAPAYEASKDFFAMSNVGFNNRLYDSTMQVAVHLAIATFNDINAEQDREITSYPISLNMIYDRLSLVDSKNTNRKMKEVREALDSLVDKGIIKTNYLYPEASGSDRALFVAKQALAVNQADEEVRTFLSIEKTTFYTLLAVDTDNRRIALMATYCAVASRIYAYKAPSITDESQGNVKVLNALELPVCFATQNTLADFVGIKTAKTVGKHIDDLVEMNLLAFYKVAYSTYQAGQWKHLISKFEERTLLREYLTFKIISHNSGNNTIVDVYDERIEAKQEAEKVQMVEVAKDSVARLQDGTSSPATESVEINDSDLADLFDRDVQDVGTELVNDLMSQLQARTKPKLNIEVDDFAKQFIMEDDDEEDFFFITGQQLMTEMV